LTIPSWQPPLRSPLSRETKRPLRVFRCITDILAKYFFGIKHCSHTSHQQARGSEKRDDEERKLEQLRMALVGMLPRLRRFGTALTGSAADGDDLVQASCERALQRVGQLRVEDRLDGWMYSIMRSVWIDELRARRVRRHEPIETAEAVVGDHGEQTTEGRLTLASVRRALAELPDEQRTVLVLVCVDGLSYREAADVLGIAIGTVMSRLARGREALHDKLDERPAGIGTVRRLGREQ
jgi:RNA polymerase sigma-70 factor (ECF subfamily)